MKPSLAWLLAFVACAAAAQPPRPPTVEQLQRAWLRCDRLAATTLVDPGTAAACSTINELLLHRVFGGDFNRLHAWWREQKEKGAPPAPLADADRRPVTR